MSNLDNKNELNFDLNSYMEENGYIREEIVKSDFEDNEFDLKKIGQIRPLKPGFDPWDSGIVTKMTTKRLKEYLKSEYSRLDDMFVKVSSSQEGKKCSQVMMNSFILFSLREQLDNLELQRISQLYIMKLLIETLGIVQMEGIKVYYNIYKIDPCFFWKKLIQGQVATDGKLRMSMDSNYIALLRIFAAMYLRFMARVQELILRSTNEVKKDEAKKSIEKISKIRAERIIDTIVLK